MPRFDLLKRNIPLRTFATYKFASGRKAATRLWSIGLLTSPVRSSVWCFFGILGRDGDRREQRLCIRVQWVTEQLL